MKIPIVLAILLVQNNVLVLMLPLDSSENEFSESAIIANIIEEENEVSNERHHKTKPRPPQYPIEILKQFEMSDQFARIGNGEHGSKDGTMVSQPRDRLFHVWLPVDVIDEDANKTTVRFQQSLSRNNLGNFTSSQITLTLRKDAELSSKTYLKVYTACEHNGSKEEFTHTQKLLKGRKYYSFIITEFMASCLKDNLTEPYLIKISFEVYESESTEKISLDFKRLFDVHVDMPLIMFFYGDFRPSETISTYSNKRQRRSVQNNVTRPSTQCQRRSFIVKPEEVDWLTVVRPNEMDLGYCSGTCPFPLASIHYNFSFHSFLLDRYRLHHAVKAPTDFPRTTCIPMTYKPIWVLEVIGSDRMDGSTIHDLAVDTCGCR